MVRLRDSWPFSLSSAPTVGNPCRPLQPESVLRDMCGRPLRSKRNLQERCGALSGADMCAASAAARSMPRAQMGDAMGRAAGNRHHRRSAKRRSAPMPQFNDQSRSHTAFKQDSTLLAVLEMSQSAWLVAGLVPGIERHPLKKIEPDEATLLRLLRRWQEEATKAGHPITRITLAFEA